jgi:hypothetical protein
MIVAEDNDNAFEEKEDNSRGSLRTQVAVLNAKVRMLTWLFKNELVTKHEFTPVKLIAFGIAALVISTVLVALLSIIIRKL